MINLPTSLEFELFQSFGKNVDETHEELVDIDL